MFEPAASTAVVALSIVLLFKLSSWSRAIPIQVSDNEFISWQCKYQSLLLILATTMLLIVYSLNQEVLSKFLSLGDICAEARAVPVFGIREDESWLTVGVSLSLFITCMTAAFMYFQVKEAGVGWKHLFPVFGWVLLFSLANSFSEEAIFRLGLIGSLHGVVSPSTLMAISAVTFGLAHYSGMPNGVIGMAMAGVLGWVLMKSVLETHGIFWAWFIHCLQDVVIIGAMVLLNAKANASAVVE